MIEITDKHKCCGCSACAAVCPVQCIAMNEDSEGFLYPQADSDRCISCGLCEKVCPVLNPGKERRPLAAYAVRNAKRSILEESASGGAFSILAEKIIEENGVVFGSGFTPEHEAAHRYTEHMEGVSQFMGSKYIQSNMGDSFRKVKEFLKNGRKVLFTGTPCQIAGLYGYLGKSPDSLITAELICHGVPSPGVWRRYLAEEIEAQHNKGYRDIKVDSVKFRDKRNAGWNGYNFTIEFSTGNGADCRKKIILSQPGKAENLFIIGFLLDLYSRPSCYDCPARSFRSGSDFTIGDFWGIEKYHTGFEDNRGVSALLVNTHKGEELLDSAECVKTPTEYSYILSNNKCLETSVTEPLARADFFSSDLPIHKRIEERRARKH